MVVESCAVKTKSLKVGREIWRGRWGVNTEPGRLLMVRKRSDVFQIYNRQVGITIVSFRWRCRFKVFFLFNNDSWWGLDVKGSFLFDWIHVGKEELFYLFKATGC
jgi:hypothetical protein